MPHALESNLKRAMRGLAQSVIVVTTAYGGERHAMVVTAVSPVSMDPPSMLVCINRAASAYATLSKGAAFCINVLAAEHEDLARFCSGPVKGEARFDSGIFATDESGLPYVIGAQAKIACVQDGRVPYGTHDVFFGRVSFVRCADVADPLVYVDGRYTFVAR